MSGFAIFLAASANPCIVGSEEITTNEAVSDFFLERSVAIIAAAKRGDLEFLDATVDSNAKIVRQAHLYSTHTGPEGLVEFATWFDPQHYAFRYHPYDISVPVAAYCADQNLEVQFLPENRSYGFLIEFNYKDGKLISATGASHILLEGFVEEGSSNG